MIANQDLVFGYGRQAPLFSGLHFTAAPGNIYGLLGKNGAGKTTLLKLIAGLSLAQKGDLRMKTIVILDVLLSYGFVAQHPDVAERFWDTIGMLRRIRYNN